MSPRKQSDGSTRLHIIVPDGLVALIDKRRGDVPRSKWVVRAMERALEPAFTETGRRKLDLDLEPGEVMARSNRGAERSVPVPEVPKREARPKTPPVARETQRDANAEYTRMMAERQARMNRGS